MSPSRRLAFVLVFLTALGVYANTCANGFAMDDRYSVVENPRLRSGSPLAFFGGAWGASAQRAQDRTIGAPYYRPLTELSLWLDYRLYGRSPAGYHGTNTVLHALISLLLTGCLWLLLVGREARAEDTARPAALAAIFGGLLFAVHGVHTEVVNLISYRGELLAALGYVAAIYLHLRFPRSPHWLDLLLLPAIYAAALCAKESAVTLPGWLALAIVLLPSEDKLSARLPRLAWRLVPLTAVLVGYLLLRASLLGPAGGNIDFFAGLSPLLKFFSVLKIFATYLQLWVFPWPLTPFYDWTVLPPATSLADGLAWFGALELLLLVAALWLLRRKAPLFALGVATFLIALVPVLHLVALPVGAGERFLYLPSLGATLATAVLVRPILARRGRLAIALLGIVLCAHAGWTVLRNTHWANDRTLQERVIADYPQAFSGHYNLGKIYLEAKEAGRAVKAFQQAESCLPGLLTTASWLAAAQLAAADPAAALHTVEAAITRHGSRPALQALRARANAALKSPPPPKAHR